MKIESGAVGELLDTIRNLHESMVQGAREWCTCEYTREMINATVENIGNLIKTFRLEHMTPVVPVNKKLNYLIDFEKIKDPDCGDHTWAELIVIFKTKLYSLIRRLMNEKDISDVASDKLEWWIETYIINDDSFSKVYREMYYSEGFTYSGYQVTQDVADEVREQRLKSPQQKLF